MTKSKGKAKAKGNAPSMSPEEAQVPSGKIVGRAQLFRVQTRHVTGRGRVLIATERIKRGARLVIETPLLRFDPSDGVIHMAKALEGLSADDKAVVSGLRQTPDDTTTLGRETVLRLSEALGQESDTRGRSMPTAIDRRSADAILT